MAIALLVFGAAPIVADEPDWSAVESEAAQLLSDYIQVDTTNPPGNEIAAARFLADLFEKEGIETKVYESEPGRGSILARLPGTGKQRPIVLLNHLDVVSAEIEHWERPPLSGEIADGYVHGRGAIDCKGVAVAEAMTLIVLKRKGVSLDRDVIFLGTADEEAGGKHGAGWFVENHLADLRNAEFLLNEGGHVRNEDGGAVFEVAISEKTPCWLRLSAEGKSGHGSTPPSETAVTRLLAALARVDAYEPDLRVTPEVDAYYKALADSASARLAERYRDIATALEDDAFREEFLSDPRASAIVHNTITPTVLQASNKTNVIPSVASADLDCRLLPGEDPQAFVATIRDVVSDEGIDVEVLLNFPPASSPAETSLYEAIRSVAQAEGSTVVPTILRGFTDSHYFRNKGIVSYGFVPLDLAPDDSGRMHGHNERMPIAGLRKGIERLVDILATLDEATD